jgi:hypothetical protein
VQPQRKLNWKVIVIAIVAGVILFVAITQTTARRDAVRGRNAEQQPLISGSP